ncbi:transmembrane protein nessy, putative [Pediculus humanus corporis]|uniref:Lysophospholipid acyltransferase 5 n=1 Tax=Pediculus humanus subsp. corporis TaxID=121224 RepID=E0W1D6_PEDHC|nr:transmembrane protein nessy, putative [Pediculus humanus corporis]EEB19442.1 transmembrane protein nessy, putative [Pediculus humanus corporis]
MILQKLIINWSELIGCSDAALTLLISLLLGYPIAFIHRKCLFGASPNIQHIYFITCGIILCCFNYGFDVIHSLASITITYLVLKIFKGGLTSLLIVFIYTMLHLTVGYWATATSTYDIKWTMPQCVLTLRLIGLAFNVYDGSQPQVEENRKVALQTVPSILEVFAHSYFPASFLVGPQFSFKRYKDFVELKLEEKELPRSLGESRKSLFLGLTYLIMYQIGSLYIPDSYFTSEEYFYLNIFKKIFFLGLWGRFTLYKYISCWLITEGSCIMMGLTYNGLDEKEKPKWDGCSNVKLKVFETSTKMNHYIESFNINTNQWIAQSTSFSRHLARITFGLLCDVSF